MIPGGGVYTDIILPSDILTGTRDANLVRVSQKPDVYYS